MPRKSAGPDASALPAASSGAPVIVARVVRPHGIRGGLLLEAETDRPEALFEPGRRLRLVGPRRRTGAGPDAPAEAPADAPADAPAAAPVRAAAGAPPEALTVESAKLHGTRWLVAVREVADRTLAEGLRGARLGVPRDELPDLPDDGYLLHDLIGMSVCEAGAAVGVIRDVYDRPGAPLLALEVAGRERLIPFEADFVVALDFEAGAVQMTLPAGLLDI